MKLPSLLALLILITRLFMPLAVAGQSHVDDSSGGPLDSWHFDLQDKDDGHWQLTACYQGTIEVAYLAKTMKDGGMPLLMAPLLVRNSQWGQCVMLLYHISHVRDLYITLQIEGISDDLVINVSKTMTLNGIKIPD